ncbi:hypothetical protein D3C75_843200 [compost metagenome]
MHIRGIAHIDLIGNLQIVVGHFEYFVIQLRKQGIPCIHMHISCGKLYLPVIVRVHIYNLSSQCKVKKSIKKPQTIMACGCSYIDNRKRQKQVLLSRTAPRDRWQESPIQLLYRSLNASHAHRLLSFELFASYYPGWFESMGRGRRKWI